MSDYWTELMNKYNTDVANNPAIGQPLTQSDLTPFDNTQYSTADGSQTLYQLPDSPGPFGTTSPGGLGTIADLFPNPPVTPAGTLTPFDMGNMGPYSAQGNQPGPPTTGYDPMSVYGNMNAPGLITDNSYYGNQAPPTPNNNMYPGYTPSPVLFGTPISDYTGGSYYDPTGLNPGSNTYTGPSGYTGPTGWAGANAGNTIAMGGGGASFPGPYANLAPSPQAVYDPVWRGDNGASTWSAPSQFSDAGIASG